eukprot:TRINITY_DN42009_c0_g1_i1.p1 TRINITY_DN42009_c0_g1~~TRINITY_DN42009_c0_g1_i1.p1  ORF type:complete len:754 (+),score=101.65 TRINITY_DN42009_c0_g1_i1:164-2425(+)
MMSSHEIESPPCVRNACANPLDQYSPISKTSDRDSSRRKWSVNEIRWLEEGVAEFGKSSWKRILKTKPFQDRSAVQLKDKWRNLQKDNLQELTPREDGPWRKWSADEIRWLEEGVQEFGDGSWKQIQAAKPFSNRSVIQLKDKWRNLLKGRAKGGTQSLTVSVTNAHKQDDLILVHNADAVGAHVDEQTLWLDLWQNIETASALDEQQLPVKARQSHSVATTFDIICTIRRRLHGKRPAPAAYKVGTLSSFALSVKRRRLMFKQPPPLQNQQTLSGPRGHYDVLLLQRTATESEIRTSYRRRALATHPDKGGNSDDFLRVSAAFEVLGDISRRSAYDRDLDIRRCSDGIATADAGSPPEGPSSGAARPSARSSTDASRVQHGAARVVQMRLLTSPKEVWKAELAKLPSPTLEAILAQLRQKKAPRGNNAMEHRPQADPACNVKCLRQDKAGYTIKVTWASFSICTGYTQSLDQAVDWHIALTWVRGVAQTRLQKAADLTSEDPLTNEELLKVLELEPSMQLTFMMGLKGSGKLVYTPSTQDLSLAMEFRHRYLTTLNSSRGNCDDEGQRLDEAKKQMLQHVLQHKKDKRTAECMLAKLVVAVISSRSGLLAALRPSSNCPTRAQASSSQISLLQENAEFAPICERDAPAVCSSGASPLQADAADAEGQLSASQPEGAAEVQQSASQPELKPRQCFLMGVLEGYFDTLEVEKCQSTIKSLLHEFTDRECEMVEHLRSTYGDDQDLEFILRTTRR